MLLTSVIIVLREILEATLLISVLLAFCQLHGMRRHWVYWALVVGLAGSLVYSATIATVSEWFDYMGQEVVNSSLQLGVYCLLLTLALIQLSARPWLAHRTLLPLVMVVMVAMAITREGSEILIYHAGLSHNPELITPLIMGGILAAGIGISTGALLYYALISIQHRHAPYVIFPLMALIGANMISQSISLLIQADWLPSDQPAWDSSALLDENSVLGQLLYALIGYEATPTPLQASAYIGSFLLLAILLLASVLFRSTSAPETLHHE